MTEKNLVQDFDRPKKITLLEKRHEYDNVYTFVFQPEEKLNFYSGQSAHVTVPGLPSPENRRSMSFTSSPQEETIAFVTEVHTYSPYKSAWKRLKEGESLYISKIKSPTILPDDEDTPVVMIAGGIGIAPYRSMLFDLHNQKRHTKATLVHVCSGPFLYEDELSTLPFEQKRIRRADIPETVREVLPANEKAVYYISGPPMFVDDLKEMLIEKGIEEDNILTSSFNRYMGFLE